MSGKEKSIELQPELIQNIHWSFARSLTLSTAVELDVFTLIKEGQVTVEKIARSVGTSLRAARMLMDALVGMGLLGKTRGNYKLTPESKTFLVRGEAHYLGNFLVNMESHYKSWQHLTQAVKTGKPVEEFASPERVKKFFKGLVQNLFSVSFASGVILAKKLGVGKTLKNIRVLDVGCGSAAWSLAFAVADTSTRADAVDFPEVIEVARSFVKKFHATKQYEFMPGDFHQVEFETNTYDAIILGHICHGEGEAGTRKLLKRCFEALKPGGKLLIPEFIANDLRTGPEIPLLFALNMLLFTENGDVFTAKEFKRWLKLVGFKKVAALAVQYPCTVIVANK